MLKLSYIIQGMTIVRVYTSQILTIIILHYSYLAINTNQTSPLLYYITIIFMISCPCIIQIHIIAYYINLIMSFTLINRLHNAAIPSSTLEFALPRLEILPSNLVSNSCLKAGPNMGGGMAHPLPPSLEGNVLLINENLWTQ